MSFTRAAPRGMVNMFAALALALMLATPAFGLDAGASRSAARSLLRGLPGAPGNLSAAAAEAFATANASASSVAALASQVVHTDEKTSGGEQWTIHHFFGFMVFAAFIAVILSIIPIVKNQEKFYDENIKGGNDTFAQYLSYRFTDWFTENKFAPGLSLLFLTLGLIVVGAIIYSLVVGGSPSHALWRIFVWSTGSPAEAEVTGGGRFLGVLVTICGLIILSLLLGIVTELFGSHMNEVKSGASRVIEGGHTVVLGYTECTRCLLEELGKAAESEDGGVFVVLAPEEKSVMEANILDGSMDLRGSRVIVRSGNPSTYRDLHKVAIGSAKGVVLLADSSMPPELADAKSLRTLLALKTKNWPTNGRITVQCCVEANRPVFLNIFPEKEVTVVVVGDIVAKLMAQSSNQSGLAGVFGMMLGFDGDEFYSQEWPELEGKTFREAVFRFPAAVALGVMTEKGECKLNPGWDYELEGGDEIIVLAEDNDTYSPTDEAWYQTEGLAAPPSGTMSPTVAGKSIRKAKPSRVLIIGWNSKVGPLLSALDSALPKGSTATIYAPRSVSDREAELSKFELQQGKKFEAFTIQHLHVEESKLTSRLELERLEHQNFESIFILADAECSRADADERTLAVLAQLQYLGEEKAESDAPPFDPVVEMCEDSTAEHLRICGFNNFVHSNSLVSQALAAVAEEPSVNAIYSDLMSGQTNVFEFRRYEDFLCDDEEPPTELSFWQAAYHVSCRADASVVAWTMPERCEVSGKQIFEMNPKDKVAVRPWSPEDRLVVIRSFRDEEHHGGALQTNTRSTKST